MRVLAVASEAVPYIKTGGLADVVGRLPAVLKGEGIEVTTLIPAYPEVLERFGSDTKVVERIDAVFGGPARLLHHRDAEGGEVLALDAPHFFARYGNPYTDTEGQDWHDNLWRFAALCRVGARLAQGEGFVPRFDAVQLHDWQAGLTAAYLTQRGGSRPAIVTTIHNLAFQGKEGLHTLSGLGLDPALAHPDGLEFYGALSTLKAGLAFADAITTVSPTYAFEIQRADKGFGMDGLLRARAKEKRLHGILNALDTHLWNPADDPQIVQPYTLRNAGAGKAANKKALRAKLGLAPDVSKPLFALVSRLTWQKGIDLVSEALDTLVALGGQCALLGTGEPQLEASLSAAQERHPGQIAVKIGYDEPLVHLMMAACDGFIMPSRFEPCGLTQMMALRYGSLPIVSPTGGLLDTVIDATPASMAQRTATGFVMRETSVEGLREALGRAMRTCAQPPLFNAMRQAAMRQPLDWTASAQAYAALFRSITERGKPGQTASAG